NEVNFDVGHGDAETRRHGGGESGRRGHGATRGSVVAGNFFTSRRRPRVSASPRLRVPVSACRRVLFRPPVSFPQVLFKNAEGQSSGVGSVRAPEKNKHGKLHFVRWLHTVRGRISSKPHKPTLTAKTTRGR